LAIAELVQVPAQEEIFLWGLTRIQFAWAVFAAVVVVAFGIDLFGFERKAHIVRTREALAWSAVWVGLALAFNVFILWLLGKKPAGEFLTAYLLEKSLSVDNLFVFLVIFEYFRVPREAESRVLHWGILGALVLRAVFIVGGVELMNRFHWMSYVFGALLLYTAVKLVVKKESDPDLSKNPVVRVAKRFLPIAPLFEGAKFFTRVEGRRMCTILLLVVLVVESTDVVFALDSIPAVLGVSRDTFIVYTSNVFAIMGLRMLYFLLANVMGLFHYLKYGLGLILAFVAVKLLLANHKDDLFEIPTWFSLSFIAGVLALSILGSLLFRRRSQSQVSERP
jgi:tellurite resistance protein TerC